MVLVRKKRSSKSFDLRCSSKRSACLMDLKFRLTEARVMVLRITKWHLKKLKSQRSTNQLRGKLQLQNFKLKISVHLKARFTRNFLSYKMLTKMPWVMPLVSWLVWMELVTWILMWIGMNQYRELSYKQLKISTRSIFMACWFRSLN